MKKVYSFILITVFSASVFGQTVPSYVPTNGLVGWWPFNGNANDESGNGNNGTVNGATLTTDRFGNANKAYSFDGVNDYIQTNFMGIIGSNSKTYSFWSKTNGLNNTVTQIMDAICSGANGSGENFEVALNHTCQGITLDINNGVNTKSVITSDNIWRNFVVVFNSAIGNNFNAVSYFSNGILLNSTCLTGVLTPINTNSLNPIVFGSYWNHLIRFFEGSLDDIGIWNRALTQAEITALYTANGVGIKDQSLNQISIYPNPAKTQITLNTTTNQIGKTLKVYDALGKVVYETILKQQQYNINITHWANGIYTVAIPEQGLTYKFVKE